MLICKHFAQNTKLPLHLHNVKISERTEKNSCYSAILFFKLAFIRICVLFFIQFCPIACCSLHQVVDNVTILTGILHEVITDWTMLCDCGRSRVSKSAVILLTLFLTGRVRLWAEMKCNTATLNVTAWAVVRRPGLWGDEEQLAPNPQVQWKAHNWLVWAEWGHCQRRFVGQGILACKELARLCRESLLSTAKLQAAGWFFKFIKYMTNNKVT